MRMTIKCGSMPSVLAQPLSPKMRTLQIALLGNYRRRSLFGYASGILRIAHFWNGCNFAGQISLFFSMPVIVLSKSVRNSLGFDRQEHELICGNWRDCRLLFLHVNYKG